MVEISGPPAVNFYSMLSGLGDVIADNRKQAAVKTALDAATQPGVSYGDAIRGLVAAGAMPQAQLYATLQAHKDQLDRQAAEDARQAARDKINDQHWAASYNLQKRSADRADDPTPDNFEANPDFGKVPGASQYRPIQGGPADPAYLGAKAKAVAEAENTGAPKYSTTPIYGTDNDPNSPTFGQPVILQAGRDGSLIRSKLPEGVGMSGNSPDSIKSRATRYLDTGDDSIINPRNFSGPQGQADYRALQNEIERQRQERGMRPDEISSNKIGYKAAQTEANAAARTKAVRETNLDLILRAADAAIPAAKEANAALPRSDFVPLNQLIQKGQIMTSDPRLVKFGMANLQLAEHWARAMNPLGVMRESDRDKALSFLNQAYGNNTYDSAVDQLRTQIDRERSAVKGSGSDYDSTRINGGRPIKVTSPQDASMYPSGTKIILPDGSPGVVP